MIYLGIYSVIENQRWKEHSFNLCENFKNFLVPLWTVRLNYLSGKTMKTNT